MPVATILSAIVGAGTTLLGGLLQSDAAKEANEKNVQLYEQQRRDTLAQQARTEAIGRQQFLENLALNREQLAFQKEEAEKSREEREEERGYNRLQNAANKYTDYLNMNQTLLERRTSPLINRG